MVLYAIIYPVILKFLGYNINSQIFIRQQIILIYILTMGGITEKALRAVPSEHSQDCINILLHAETLHA